MKFVAGDNGISPEEKKLPRLRLVEHDANFE